MHVFKKVLNLYSSFEGSDLRLKEKPISRLRPGTIFIASFQVYTYLIKVWSMPSSFPPLIMDEMGY